MSPPSSSSGASRSAWRILPLLLALLGGSAGCGASADPGAGPSPGPPPEGCVPYDQFAAGDVPCRAVVSWIGGVVMDVDVEGDLAALASLTSGLRIVDVGDPRAPRLLGAADSPEAVAVDLEGDLVAVAEGVHGFSLYDVSDPTAPVHLVRQAVATGGSSPGYTDAVALAGNRLLVSGFHRNLVCYDVSDPRHPLERGRVVIERPGDLAVVGNRVIAGGRAVVAIALSGGLTVVADMPYGAAEDLCVADGRVFAAVAEGLAAYDVSFPDSVRALGLEPLVGARCVAAAGEHVFVGAVDGVPRLHAYDFSSPTSPVELGEAAAPGYAVLNSLACAGGMLLAGDRHLRTIEIADPAQPIYLPEPKEPAYPQGLVVVGSDFAVFEGARVYLHRVGATEAPTAPIVLACGQTIVHAAANGSHMYFARATGGLVVVDPANPAPPTVQHAADGFGPLAATDSLLAVGDGGTLRLYGLADPGAPVAVGALVFDDFVQEIAVRGTQVLLSLAAAQLALVDASDPARPRVAAIDDPGLQLENSAAVAWSDSSGLDLLAGGALRLVRLQSDGSLVTTSALASVGIARALAVQGPVAYVVTDGPGDAGATVTAIDFTDPAGLRLVGRAVRPWVVLTRLQIAGDRAYGLTTGGILEFPLDCHSLPAATE